jgi:hypothetical protein
VNASTTYDPFDLHFRDAVTAMDSGDVVQLTQILDNHPELVKERLYKPGKWLTSVIGDALNGFFKAPYLLWFISEDAVRNKTLPANIDKIASIIIEKAKNEKADNLQEQLDFTLRLVGWSTVARDAGVQVRLIDVLVNAGASVKGGASDALVNGNSDAARRLLDHGDPLTLPTALYFEHWKEADALAQNADQDTLQLSLVLSALNGKPQAVAKAIEYGADIHTPSRHLYSHATALHHAVWSGSLETVKVLVNAGASLKARDSIYDGTPLGWAEHAQKEDIIGYLNDL